MGLNVNQKTEETPEGKAFLEAYADPANSSSIRQLCIKHGINNSTAGLMIKRSSDKICIDRAEQKLKYSAESAISQLNELSTRAFSSAFDKLDEASAYQCALIGAIAIDKSFLIQNAGVVNVNVNHEHRIELSESGGMLMRELKSRNLLPDTGEVIDISADG